MTFRKERLLGIWVNADSRVFEDAPAYLAVLSNRPLNEIAGAETLRRLQLGLTIFPCRSAPSSTLPLPAAMIRFGSRSSRSRAINGLYREVSERGHVPDAGAVPCLHSAPAEVPVGTYQVDVRLFADGAQIARAPSPFEVYKVRLRADRHRCRARLRPALWTCHRLDGAGHRLARFRGVPPGLIGL